MNDIFFLGRTVAEFPQDASVLWGTNFVIFPHSGDVSFQELDSSDGQAKRRRPNRTPKSFVKQYHPT